MRRFIVRIHGLSLRIPEKKIPGRLHEKTCGCPGCPCPLPVRLHSLEMVSCIPGDGSSYPAYEYFFTLHTNRNTIQGGTLPWLTRENSLSPRSGPPGRNRKRYGVPHGGSISGVRKLHSGPVRILRSSSLAARNGKKLPWKIISISATGALFPVMPGYWGQNRRFRQAGSFSGCGIFLS